MKSTKPFGENPEQGVGLISVMLAVAILSMVVLLASGSLANAMEHGKVIRARNDATELRLYISSASDCAAVRRLHANTCSNRLRIVDAKGRTIVAPAGAGGTRIGRYDVAVTCRGRSIGIFYRVHREPPEPQEQWQSLYDRAPYACTFR